ncbi:hypothetical protein SALBM311S_09292 [Streptomyces alboniger]
MVTLLLQGLTLPWLVSRLGVRADTEREKRYEKELAVRAAKAAKRRFREIEAVEELPEELSERRCCGGPSTSGCGSVRTSGTRSGVRRRSSGPAG